MTNRFFVLFFSLLLLVSCGRNGSTEKCGDVTEHSPRNVILLIGDGMGVNQVYAAMTAAGGGLAMSQMPYTAFVKTFSANRYITDSAAGGTALACGKKTDNGMLGVTPDTVAVESLLEHYKALGYATGLVATSTITHATPASFYAHIASRGEEDEIAVQLVNAGVDFFCGGGRNNFELRADSVVLTDSLVERGYSVHYSIDSLRAPLLLPAAILAADGGMPAAEERGDFLPQATDLAIKSLKAKAGNKGFFLMVEGSQIDWSCHGNDGPAAVAEVLDFDKAVAAALYFAKNDGNTLVVVTADHETGGMTIVDGSFENEEIEVSFGRQGVAGTSVGHTGTMVPLFAFGPGAELFHGVIDNTRVPEIIKNK